MDAELEQQEEIEALKSIYEGDSCFKQINKSTFQYKYGEDESDKAFIVEISWGPNYPTELPNISMDTYYNRNISASIKSKIVELLTAEAQNWLGCGMTYTLFEAIKERLTELLDDLEKANEEMNSVTENVKAVQLAPVIKTSSAADGQVPVKKEQLTKTQKRRMWERTDNKGQRLRGWNWVDIIRHLSQTGQGKDDTVVVTNSNISQIQAPLTNNN